MERKTEGRSGKKRQADRRADRGSREPEALREQPVTEVVIDGRVVPLIGGDAEYLQRVAAYLDGKITELKQSRQYLRQNSKYRTIFLWLNLADDCMQARDEAYRLRADAERHDAEIYSLKREIVEKRLEAERLAGQLERASEGQRAAEEQSSAAQENAVEQAGIGQSSALVRGLEDRIRELERQLSAREIQAEEEKRRTAEQKRRADELESRLTEEQSRAEALEKEVDELLEK